MTATAVFSPCRTWRYSLSRPCAGTGPWATVLGINPSNANEDDNDHTVTKLVGFGARLDWGGFHILNPFALVSTDQRGLLTATDPIGPENDAHLAAAIAASGTIVAAWGSGKSATVRKLLKARLWSMRRLFDGRVLMCFGVARDGAPRHPLMLSYDTPLQPWRLP